jgi:hypothetical protein
VRNPIKATTRVSINRPDTYERLPKPCEILNCEQQPTHTFGPRDDYGCHRAFEEERVRAVSLPASRQLSWARRARLSRLGVWRHDNTHYRPPFGPRKIPPSEGGAMMRLELPVAWPPDHCPGRRLAGKWGPRSPRLGSVAAMDDCQHGGRPLLQPGPTDGAGTSLASAPFRGRRAFRTLRSNQA